ncbi:MAG: Asparagine synthetase (glutamine-hydrolyzing) 1 [Syntrophomonadaceae bacterium]|nr:Asparagine synthetase (glutamine-hydrolyzing) 1 [Bacillota bacterium]
MCGFVALWRKSGSFPLSAGAEAAAALRHRGPDDEGQAEFGHAALFFRRLAVIDLSERGRQPMYNEDGTLCMVFNGEIYNFRLLREELRQKGHLFKSESDSEVILHLYEEEGEYCVRRLRGMFAFCLYDGRRRLFFGARDRFGIKPLYCLENEHYLVLASEAKAFLELPGFTPKVNEGALPHYLTFQYVPEPETMLAGVRKIPPAHSFVWQAGHLETKRYWQAEFSPQERPLQEFIEGTQTVLREAVRLHTQADVPWGAFLSGGIDSTVVAALLRESGPVSTFSVGYADEAYSELAEARETARYLETDHEEYVIEASELWNHLPQLVWHLDDPVADPAAMALFFVARLARRKITVTLSGEGADEVFGGYAIYREPQALKYMDWLPRPLLEMWRLLPDFVRGRNYLRRAATPLEQRYFGNALIFTEEEKRLLLKKNSFSPAAEITRPFYHQAEAYDDVTKMQYLDLHTWMLGDILVKADKMTMANSLELRVPYLDHHVFEFAATIPTKYKIRAGMTKYVLRQAFKDEVPAAVVRRQKRGFPVPTRVWLRDALFKEAQSVLDDPALREYFSPLYLKKLLAEHKEGRADNSRKIWALLIFALWMERFTGKSTSFVTKSSSFRFSPMI